MSEFVDIVFMMLLPSFFICLALHMLFEDTYNKDKSFFLRLWFYGYCAIFGFLFFYAVIEKIIIWTT